MQPTPTERAIQTVNPENPSARQHNTPVKIAFFGHYGGDSHGSENYGNESTLQAILACIRASAPEVTIVCVCDNPAVVASRYNIAAVPIRSIPQPQSADHKGMHSWRIVRILRRTAGEIPLWINIMRQVRSLDHLIVAGTGALDDFAAANPLGPTLDLFRWTFIAKLLRVRLSFVSVGAGPIHHPLNRKLMKWSLAMGSYRSYRDEWSRNYMQSIGFDTSQDQIYPDLVFSRPKHMLPPQRARPKSPHVIGVGVMTYLGWSGSSTEIYDRYVQNVAGFTAWLIRQGYQVRLLVGQRGYDEQAVTDIGEAAKQELAQSESTQLINDTADSVEAVFDQIAATDLVVATRFHNVVYALMLGKPVISIGYAAKNEVLQAEMGLGNYCQHIEQLDVDLLMEQFSNLVKNYHSHIACIEDKNEEYRKALDEQYAYILQS
jgi:polysaccharide pyruvyl transferase WcaK-like protein